jgi:hypothetical protein
MNGRHLFGHELPSKGGIKDKTNKRNKNNNNNNENTNRMKEQIIFGEKTEFHSILGNSDQPMENLSTENGHYYMGLSVWPMSNSVKSINFSLASCWNGFLFTCS